MLVHVLIINEALLSGPYISKWDHINFDLSFTSKAKITDVSSRSSMQRKKSFQGRNQVTSLFQDIKSYFTS